jgi:hypothetical protein
LRGTGGKECPRDDSIAGLLSQIHRAGQRFAMSIGGREKLDQRALPIGCGNANFEFAQGFDGEPGSRCARGTQQQQRLGSGLAQERGE